MFEYNPDYWKTIDSTESYIHEVLNFADSIHCNKIRNLCNKPILKSKIIESTIKEIEIIGPSILNDNCKANYDKSIKLLTDKKIRVLNPPYYEFSSYRLYYRGLSSTIYNLLPSGLRYTDSNLEESNHENYYYNQMEIMCPDEFVERTHFDHMIMMQHYGCPTRLLDITSNPLVALYFACLPSQDNNLSGREGIVHVFASPENEILNYSNDIVTILSCLPAMTNHEKEMLTDACYNALKNDTNIHGNENDGVKALYTEIQKERPGYNTYIDPLDILSVHFVQPTRNNRRLEKQCGAFIISGLSKKVMDTENLIQGNVALSITIKNKAGILKELERLDITEATLFPEVERVAGYLKNKQKVFMLDGSLPPT